MTLVLLLVLINSFTCFNLSFCFRIVNLTDIFNSSFEDVFVPYNKSFVGTYGDASNLQRERINEGAYYSPDQEIIFESVSLTQDCPGVVGPFTDGSYYCTSKANGYCDRRSGTCFCNMGYQGLDCSECTPSYFAIDSLCLPKKLCPNDCSGAGQCNYLNGTCTCELHRYGESCEFQVCLALSPLCESCTGNRCDNCMTGYYLTLDERVCSSCNDFDARCSSCNIENGCTACADSLLRSIRRSGKRSIDADEPFEEATRDLSINLPFGTQDPSYFTEVETYYICTTADQPLNEKTISCSQGLSFDSNFTCLPKKSSNKVCGHAGFFKFQYNNYTVNERDKYLRIFVERSGGGYSSVNINYYIKHITTDDSDIFPTAFYTSSQTLEFPDGVIEKSFLITIADDIIYEENEQFQIILSQPSSGSLNSQYVAMVTIIDNDLQHVNPATTFWDSKLDTTIIKNSYQYYSSLQSTAGGTTDDYGPITITADPATVKQGIVTRAGFPFTFTLKVVTYNGDGNNTRTFSTKDTFYTIIRNKHNIRQKCNTTANEYNQSYYIATCLMTDQGVYKIHNYYAYQGSLIGQYFSDTKFKTLKLTRSDREVNFTWGSYSSRTAMNSNTKATSPLASEFITNKVNSILSSYNQRIFPTGNSDYISIRWQGAIMTNISDTYLFKIDTNDQVRLWLDGKLILDYFILPYTGSTNFNPTSTSTSVGSSSRNNAKNDIGNDSINNQRGIRSFPLEANELYEIVIEYRTFQQTRNNPNLNLHPDINMPSYISLKWCRLSLFDLNNNDVGKNFTVITEDYLYSLYELSNEQPGSLKGDTPSKNAYNNPFINVTTTGTGSNYNTTYTKSVIPLGSPISLIVVSDQSSPVTSELVFYNDPNRESLQGIVSDNMIPSQVSVDELLLETNPYASFITKTLQPYVFSVCPRDKFGNIRNDDDAFYSSTEIFTGQAVLVDTHYVSDIVNFNIYNDNNNNDISTSNSNSNVSESQSINNWTYEGSGTDVVDAIVMYNITTHCFDYSITPEQAGTYLFTVYYEDRNSISGEKIPVKDSPFEIYVLPSTTYGPTSRVYNLPVESPLQAISGQCYNFLIEARDRFNNRQLRGGETNNIIVYLYEVGTFPLPAAFVEGSTLFASPSAAPSSTTSAPTTFTEYMTTNFDILNDAYNPYRTDPLATYQSPEIVYGEVFDQNNGNYTVSICPIKSGIYEIHVLLNGHGVSNQFSLKSIFTNTIYDRQNNRNVADIGGQYIDKSPYPLIVSHNTVYGPTTTAYGPGLIQGTASIPIYYFVTVRDAGSNIVSDDVFPYTIEMSLDLSIKNSVKTDVNYFDLHNGTWLIEYRPVFAGINLLTVLVNGKNISGSPFAVTILEGSPSSEFSNIIGDAAGVNITRTTIAGVPYYFEIQRRDVEGNLQVLLNGTKPKITNFEYIANTPDGKNHTGSLQPCPLNPNNDLIGDGRVCRSDGLINLYYGSFTPLVIGTTTIHIYLVTVDGNGTKTLEELSSSPFTLLVTEGSPFSTNTDVSGTLYETIAGKTSYVYMHLRDIYGNLISKSGSLLINQGNGSISNIFNLSNPATVLPDTRRIPFHMKVLPVRIDFVPFLSSSYSIPSNSNPVQSNTVSTDVSLNEGMKSSWNDKMNLFESFYYQGLYYEPTPIPDNSTSTSTSTVSNIQQEANIIDNYDGSYVASYSIPNTGVYGLLLSLTQPGLIMTEYTDTTCGSMMSLEDNSMVSNELYSKIYNDSMSSVTPLMSGSQMASDSQQTIQQDQFSPVSTSSRIISTLTSDQPASSSTSPVSSYISLPLPLVLPQNKAHIVSQTNYTTSLAFLLPTPASSTYCNQPTTSTCTKNDTTIGKNKLLQEYISVRWEGLMTPYFAEKYRFIVNLDEYATFRLFLGIGLNRKLILNCTALPSKSEITKTTSRVDSIKLNAFQNNQCEGFYVFNLNDLTHSTVIIIEYVHYTKDEKNTNSTVFSPSFFKLYWESVSTPYTIVPGNVLSHWATINKYNLTIIPTDLCSACSTVTVPNQIIAGENIQIIINARDKYSNLLINNGGGLTPTVVAVGPDGSSNVIAIGFIGDSDSDKYGNSSSYRTVQDYKNSTYKIDFDILKTGVYRIYVTIGCCPPAANIGYPGVIDRMRNLLAGGRNNPYLLTILPTVVSSQTTYALGLQGLTGGYAGRILSFYIHLRDVYNNYINSSHYITTSTSPITTSKINNVSSYTQSSVAYTSITQLDPKLLQFKFIDENNNQVIPIYLNISVPSFHKNGNVQNLSLNKDAQIPEEATLILVQYNMTKTGNYKLHINLMELSMDSNNLSKNSQSKYNPIAQSPFPILIDSDSPSAIHTVLPSDIKWSESSIYANQPFTFHIYIRDQFNNIYSSKRSNLYVRLYGDYCDSLSESDVALIGNDDSNVCSFNNRLLPVCTSISSGEYYVCKATARDMGKHQLDIKLLNSSYPLTSSLVYLTQLMAVTGASLATVEPIKVYPFVGDTLLDHNIGDGLTSTYYTSYNWSPMESSYFLTVESSISSIAMTTSQSCATATTVRDIKGSSSHNDILQLSTIVTAAMREQGDLQSIKCVTRSIIYDGYFLAPDSGPFYFRIASPDDYNSNTVVTYNAEIYIDGILIFDTKANQSITASNINISEEQSIIVVSYASCTKSTSYHIRVLLTAIQPYILANITYSLQYAYTPSEKLHIHNYDLRPPFIWYDIPTQYLYSSAQDINSNPQTFYVQNSQKKTIIV